MSKIEIRKRKRIMALFGFVAVVPEPSPMHVWSQVPPPIAQTGRGKKKKKRFGLKESKDEFELNTEQSLFVKSCFLKPSN